MAKTPKKSGTRKKAAKKSAAKKKVRRRSAPKKPAQPKAPDKKPEVPTTGRRTILTPELQAEIITVISAGNYYSTACKYVGIPESTFYNWLSRGQLELDRMIEAEKQTGEDEKPRESEIIFLEFLEAVQKADAQGEVSAVLALKSHFKKSHQAPLAYLERKHANNWGRKDKLDVGLSGGGGLVVAYIPDNGRPDDNKQEPILESDIPNQETEK